MFNLAVKNFFEKNLPLKVYGNLNAPNPCIAGVIVSFEQQLPRQQGRCYVNKQKKSRQFLLSE